MPESLLIYFPFHMRSPTPQPRSYMGLGESLRVGKMYHESRRCSRYTSSKSHITMHTSIRRYKFSSVRVFESETSGSYQNFEKLNSRPTGPVSSVMKKKKSRSCLVNSRGKHGTYKTFMTKLWSWRLSKQFKVFALHSRANGSKSVVDHVLRGLN